MTNETRSACSYSGSRGESRLGGRRCSASVARAFTNSPIAAMSKTVPPCSNRHTASTENAVSATTNTTNLRTMICLMTGRYMHPKTGNRSPNPNQFFRAQPVPKVGASTRPHDTGPTARRPIKPQVTGHYEVPWATVVAALRLSPSKFTWAAAAPDRPAPRGRTAGQHQEPGFRPTP